MLSSFLPFLAISVCRFNRFLSDKIKRLWHRNVRFCRNEVYASLFITMHKHPTVYERNLDSLILATIMLSSQSKFSKQMEAGYSCMHNIADNTMQIVVSGHPEYIQVTNERIFWTVQVRSTKRPLTFVIRFKELEKNQYSLLIRKLIELGSLSKFTSDC